MAVLGRCIIVVVVVVVVVIVVTLIINFQVFCVFG